MKVTGFNHNLRKHKKEHAVSAVLGHINHNSRTILTIQTIYRPDKFALGCRNLPTLTTFLLLRN